MTRVKLTEIKSYFENKDYYLFMALGFDERTLSLLGHIDVNCINKVYCIANIIDESSYSKKISLFENMTNGCQAELIGMNEKSIIPIIDILQNILKKLDLTGKKIALDVTSFSHELLIAVIGLFANEDLLNKITLFYIAAKEYGYDNKDNIWLSRGVVDIRSVLGFPGIMLPSKDLHLLILSGFEVDRAIEIFERYEPTNISIGIGEKLSALSIVHQINNEKFATMIKQYISDRVVNRGEIGKFYFSSADPIKTSIQILGYIKKYPNENFVICPLNTKISTVGAALAGLLDSRLQICYVQPQEYNINGYANPSDEVTIVSLENSLELVSDGLREL